MLHFTFFSSKTLKSFFYAFSTISCLTRVWWHERRCSGAIHMLSDDAVSRVKVKKHCFHHCVTCWRTVNNEIVNDWHHKRTNIVMKLPQHLNPLLSLGLQVWIKNWSFMRPFHKVNLTWKVPKEIEKWFWMSGRQKREKERKTFLKICEETRFILLPYLPSLRTKNPNEVDRGRRKKRKTFIDTTLEPLFFSLISLSGRLDDAKDTSKRKSNYTPSHVLICSVINVWMFDVAQDLTLKEFIKWKFQESNITWLCCLLLDALDTIHMTSNLKSNWIKT